MTSKANKSAMVTGGATGIGRAISLHLARQGFNVSIVYSKSEVEAQDTGGEIERLGGRYKLIRADVSQPQEAAAAVDGAMAAFGRLDWLVNNAGITYQLPFSELDRIEDTMWDDLFATNVKGVFYCCRAAAPFLAKSEDGAILNTGSIAGETGYGSSIPYAVSKAATHGLTRSLARALAPSIRVNAIAPGAVDTRWWAGNEDKMNLLAGKLPLGRISDPDDIADTAFMVLSAKSMTGQVIRLENGQTL
jgi:3-oxoacyl-[acyl-carrier protein] reductase